MIYVNDSSSVWHVAKSGSDSNSGHAGQYPVNLANDAKLTIGAAVSAAASGDTIIIWPGDYNEYVFVASKTLTLIGTSRKKTKIISPDTNAGIKFNTGTGSVVRNLSVEALTSGAVGINIDNNSDGVIIDGVDVSASFDGITCTSRNDVRISNSTFKGKYDGGNWNGASRLLVDNCIFYTDGTYGTSSPARGMYLAGCYGVIRNSIFWAERADSSSQDCGGIATVSASRAANLVFENCIFYGKNGANNTGQCFGAKLDYANDKIVFANCVFAVPANKGYIYGVFTNKAGAVALLKNCIISASASGSPTELYDLKDAIGSIIVAGCGYSTSNGVITQQGEGWASGLATALFTNGLANKLTIDASGRVVVGSNADKTDYGLSAGALNLIATTLFLDGGANKLKIDSAGRVDVGSIEGTDAVILEKAAKILTNKAVQDKLTGVIRYYDGDGQTVLLTHTPTENETSVTRMPS